MAMNRAWKKQVTSIPSGTQIQGKFKGNSYLIKRKIGEGAIGTVYLCQFGKQTAALKISEKQTSMTLEVNVLKALKQVRGNLLGPALLDVDDWLAPNRQTYTFYVMEYVHGESMQQFFRKNGASWLGLLMVQLLEDLEKLHKAGWVFGDLKTDNLLISQAPPKIRWIDVGGVTQIGRAIKEYTEFYDRGYWGLGSRRAEPSYDLFSVAIIFLEIFYPQRFARPETKRANLLFKKIDKVKALQPYAPVLKKAITGKYTTSAEMQRELKQIIFSRKNQSRSKTGKIGLSEAMWIFLFSILSILTSLCF
ncbi:protein kinase domain-containing protein [Oceanobacillus indicireducens]|uniref:Serine/threonine-protein kinase YabT n=1 Tax=Oceanobacillus indicireducens TaxID=1004261 RepID=A0A917Y3E4_9BACI|nr:protein kinase [Oceanobacillus indicireducens]GGN63437.1 putative serine/threonine-protein kinase YabT [Oceanobacillus indicireducens]